MPRRTVTHKLPVKLTNDEILRYNKTLVELLSEQRQTDQDSRKVSAEFRERLKELKGNITRLATMLKSGHEYREVECFEEPNFDQGVVEVFRSDTGERVHARAMTDGDRQTNIEVGYREV